MCFICQRIELIKNQENPYFVRELETGYVVLGDYQRFPGYTLFLCKQHVTELFQLEESYKMQYLKEMSILAEAVSKAFDAEKMNYELLGNGDSHIHWHLFPRRNGDLGQYGVNGRGPVWCLPAAQLYAEENRPSKEELEDMKQRLNKELDALL